MDAFDTALLKFDTAFGQFNTAEPEVVFLGSHATHGSFFSFNDRGGEASIYDAVTDTWVTSGWNPEGWLVEKVANISSKQAYPSMAYPFWTGWLSA